MKPLFTTTPIRLLFWVCWAGTVAGAGLTVVTLFAPCEITPAGIDLITIAFVGLFFATYLCVRSYQSQLSLVGIVSWVLCGCTLFAGGHSEALYFFVFYLGIAVWMAIDSRRISH